MWKKNQINKEQLSIIVTDFGIIDHADLVFDFVLNSNLNIKVSECL